MRLALAIALSALGATTAAAQAASDRYGFAPAPSAAANAAAPSIEARGMQALSWAHKTVPSPVVATPRPVAVAEVRGEVAGYGANRAWLPPPPSAPRWRPSAYQPFTPQEPYQAQQQQLAALTPLPARVIAPPPAPDPAPTPRRQAAPRAAMPDLAGGPHSAAAPPASTPQVAQNAGTAVHYYSVHRGYGLIPDAIPEPPRDRGYVLIGPSDTASAPKDRERNRDDDDDDAKRDAPF